MELSNIIIAIPVLFFAMVIHEFSHGWVAERVGDITARQMGRLTLNPFAHIDPMGTVILPFLLIIMGSPILFGWAKPVPINPLNFNNPKRDIVWVGLAGSGANVILAIMCGLLLRLSFLIGMYNIPYLGLILQLGVFINLILGIFNLIPVPPLDGSKVLMGLLPDKLAYKLSRLEPYGIIILMVLIWFTPIIGLILGLVVTPLYNLLVPGIMLN